MSWSPLIKPRHQVGWYDPGHLTMVNPEWSEAFISMRGFSMSSNGTQLTNQGWKCTCILLEKRKLRSWFLPSLPIAKWEPTAPFMGPPHNAAERSSFLEPRDWVGMDRLKTQWAFHLHTFRTQAVLCFGTKAFLLLFLGVHWLISISSEEGMKVTV